uniref:Thioredoxin-like_fold domain-containing protein n=1 Tax=Angiostrongylus cantonensis TaxID=6313 RepID=A0A158P9W5_ANGCA
MDSCCRSLLASVDWDIACASSSKYHWEDEEMNTLVEERHKESRRTRNHWTKQVLAATKQCVASLDLFNYSLPNVGSIRGLRCTKRSENDTLTFVILDSLHYQYFLNKWGLRNVQLPVIIAIDASRELFSVMDGRFSQDRVRDFILDYHSKLIPDNLLSEEDGRSRFVKENILLEKRPYKKRTQVLERLTQQTFHPLIETRHNSSHDVVVFFSGGIWHAPSTTAMHVYHNSASYFSSSGDLIKFYVIDTTRNELPYNFNFERVPTIVIFLANRTDISWKYPDGLPISQPNLLSFVLSHCSTRLRWKMALTNCGRICVIQLVCFTFPLYFVACDA